MTNVIWGILCLVAIGGITLGIPWITDSKIVRAIGFVLNIALAVTAIILYTRA